MSEKIVNDIFDTVDEFNRLRKNAGCMIFNIARIKEKLPYDAIYYYCVLSKLSSIARTPLITNNRESNKDYIHKIRHIQNEVANHLAKLETLMTSAPTSNDILLELHIKYKCPSFLRFVKFDNKLMYKIIENNVAKNNDAERVRRFWHKSYLDKLKVKRIVVNHKLTKIMRNSGLNINTIHDYQMVNRSRNIIIDDIVDLQERVGMHPTYISMINNDLNQEIEKNMSQCGNVNTIKYSNAFTEILSNMNHNKFSTSQTAESLAENIVEDIKNIMYFTFVQESDTSSFKYREEYYMSSNIIIMFLEVFGKKIKLAIDKINRDSDVELFPLDVNKYSIIKESLKHNINFIINGYNLNKVQAKFERSLCF